MILVKYSKEIKLIKLNQIKRKTKSALRKNNNQRSGRKFDQIKKIGILYDVTAAQISEDIDRLTRILAPMGVVIKEMGYLDKPQKQNQSMHTFSKEDFSLFGKVKSSHVEDFIEEPFDYLIHPFSSNNPLIDYILAHSKAYCRVGLHDPAREQFYDLMVFSKGSEPLSKVLDQILESVKIFQ